MKTTVLLVRHGQSLGNLVHSFLGHTDLDLSPLGYEQAALLGDYLKDRKIDAAEASDLCRAFHTAEGALRHHGLPIAKNPAFREIFAGEWENQLATDIAERYPEAWEVWRNDIGHACPVGGESVAELAARIYRAFDELVARHLGKTVLVATHATPIRLLKARALGVAVEDARKVQWAGNASLTEITVEDGVLSLTLDGEESYLGDRASTFFLKT